MYHFNVSKTSADVIPSDGGLTYCKATSLGLSTLNPFELHNSVFACSIIFSMFLISLSKRGVYQIKLVCQVSTASTFSQTVDPVLLASWR
jgi:hypothetical protein